VSRQVELGEQGRLRAGTEHGERRRWVRPHACECILKVRSKGLLRLLWTADRDV
jgi:hypothetical protein